MYQITTHTYVVCAIYTSQHKFESFLSWLENDNDDDNYKVGSYYVTYWVSTVELGGFLYLSNLDWVSPRCAWHVMTTCIQHFSNVFTNKWWHHQHVRILCHHFITREISVTHMPKLMVQFVGRTSRVAYLHPTCSTCNIRVTPRELPVPYVSKHVRYLCFTCFHHVKYLQTTCQFSTLRVNHAPLV